MAGKSPYLPMILSYQTIITVEGILDILVGFPMDFPWIF
jgi:hypothetical protein